MKNIISLIITIILLVVLPTAVGYFIGESYLPMAWLNGVGVILAVLAILVVGVLIFMTIKETL